MQVNVELWRPVVNYEGGYEVSSFGRVRSLDRQIICSDGRVRNRKGNMMRLSKRQNYLSVELFKNGVGTKRKVAHLVAEAFIGPKPEGLIVLHGPNGSLDNSVFNLSYGTYKDNNYDRLRDGTMPMGETHKRSKLKEADVRGIFYLHELGWSKRQIADFVGVTYQNVHAVLIGKTWKHIVL
jgi:hypothetical protein